MPHKKRASPGKELREKRKFAKSSGAEKLMQRMSRTKKRTPGAGESIGRGAKLVKPRRRKR